MNRVIVICAVIVLFSTGATRADTWTTLDAPWASSSQPSYGTHVSGISGNNLVGYYEDNSGNSHGFLYDGTTWTKFDDEGALWSKVNGISGNNIVGSYFNALLPPPWNTEVAFIDYGSGACATFVNFPNLTTRLSGVDGGNAVGSYTNTLSHITNSFLYNGTNTTNLNMPGATSTYAQGIEGSDIVGYYTDVFNNDHGFLYNGTDWTTLNMPQATETYAYGISGNKIAGQYLDSSGTLRSFLYDGTTWTTINKRGCVTIKYKAVFFHTIC